MRAYDSGMLRAAFVSLFWACITDQRKRGPFTFQQLAKNLNVDKGEVSRWFNGEPNWRLSTIASIADALDLDIQVIARERSTGKIFTPSGLQSASGMGDARKTTTRAPNRNGKEAPSTNRGNMLAMAV
jgi:transcriptional regulator with XRE-family HTH domain